MVLASALYKESLGDLVEEPKRKFKATSNGSVSLKIQLVDQLSVRALILVLHLSFFILLLTSVDDCHLFRAWQL